LFFSSIVRVILSSFGSHSRLAVGPSVLGCARCVECSSMSSSARLPVVALVEKRIERFEH
jgi:hypothetical protein